MAHATVGLHATDPASVFLSALARLREPRVEAIERALYEDRSLLRILGMRRTMFTVPVELAGVVHAAATRAIALVERRKTVQLLAEGGIADDPEGWLLDVERAAVEALERLREATAAELSEVVPQLRRQLVVGVGTKWEGRLAVATRVLFLLAADGRIVRGRPRGSSTSSQYRWATLDTWLPGGLPDWPTEAAREELVRRWLTAYGPGTERDLRWWTGWTAREVRQALAGTGAVEVDLDGERGLVLADDLGRAQPVEPWAALLPALDPAVMGWKERAWFLGAHGPALFDRSGNVGPTVWWNGRVVGGWAQRGSGEIVFRLLEDAGAAATAAVEAAAERLGGLLGTVTVTPRFRTPLERDLTA